MVHVVDVHRRLNRIFADTFAAFEDALHLFIRVIRKAG
jgi:hypothetical protein